MALLSDRNSFDRMAGQRCNVAITSQSRVFDIEDVCALIDYPLPVTEDDLRGIVLVCDTWGIRVNVDQEAWWKAFLQ